jgi:uncharacterized damage-inducible protein DinB
MNKVAVIQELRHALDLTLPCFDWDAALLARSYGAGKWNARQILAHLADCEVVYQARARTILSEPGAAVVPFDQDKWARTLAYPQRSVPLMRRLYTTNRESLIELVDLLPEPLFGREGKHPEHASYRAWDIVTKAATHNMHHYGQLVAIRDGTGWSAPNAG